MSIIQWEYWSEQYADISVGNSQLIVHFAVLERGQQTKCGQCSVRDNFYPGSQSALQGWMSLRPQRTPTINGKVGMG